MGLSYIWLQNNIGRYVKQSWNHCKLRWLSFYISLNYTHMILHILFKGLVCPLITKSPAAERFSKDWPRSEASWGNVKFWSSTDFLVASTIALSIFYFVAVIELHAIKKTTVILLYFKHPIKRKYFEVTNMKAILAVMNTTELVVKIRPEKNSGLHGIWTHDLSHSDPWPQVLFSLLVQYYSYLRGSLS